MGLISFTNISDGTTIDAADVNSPLNTIYNDYNGNIDSTNLADNAVTTAKITDANITASKFGVGAITGADGWVSTTDTWTYASASTFTVAGDKTSIYTTGTRLKFSQTTVKYAVVISSVYTSVTTVTIAVNTDYTIANAAITDTYYSYCANPQGYPGSFNYTTTITATGGTAPTYSVNSCKLSVNGRVVNAVVQLQNTSGGTAGSGAVVLYVSKPVSVATNSIDGTFKSYEESGTLYSGLISDNSASDAYLTRYDMVSNVVANDQSSANRYLQLSFCYVI